MNYGAVRETFTRDQVVTKDNRSAGGVVASGEANVLNQWEVLMLDGATGKWGSYNAGTYAAGEKLGILKDDLVDATVSDAGVSLLLAGNVRRASINAVTTMTTVLEAQLMQSGIFLD